MAENPYPKFDSDGEINIDWLMFALLGPSEPGTVPFQKYEELPQDTSSRGFMYDNIIRGEN